MGGHRERKAHVHTAAVAFDWGIQEFINFGKCDDFIELVLHLDPRHPKNCPIQKDVFASSKFRMKTGAHFKQTRYASQNPYASLRWFGDPAQELEQRGLAGTIATDDANHVAPPDFETHVSKCPEFFQHVTLDYGLAAKNVSRLPPDAVRPVHQHVPE